MRFYDILTTCTEETSLPDEVTHDREKMAEDFFVPPTGLLLDGNEVPVCLDTVSCTTLNQWRQKLQDFKNVYGFQRIIVVGDRGTLCSSAIDLLSSQGDGYVMSQSLTGKEGKHWQKELFSQEGWQGTPDGAWRWKLFTESCVGDDITFRQEDGEPVKIKKSAESRRQVLLYWSLADAKLAAKKREESRSMAAAETAEIPDGKLDGFSAVITSELDYDAAKIYDVCHGLSRNGDAFRIRKRALDSIPVFQDTQKHLQAHFLICYSALVIVRLMQTRMGEEKLSAKRIADALREANCLIERGGYVRLLDVGGSILCQKRYDPEKQEMVPALQFSIEDRIAADYRKIQETFGTQFFYAYAKQEDFKRFFNDMHLRT